MSPGPKPIELEALKTEASNWARILFTLRYGQVALVTAVKWVDTFETEGGPVALSPEIRKGLAGTPWENAKGLNPPKKYRVGTTLGAETFTFDQFEKKKLPKQRKPDDALVWYPPTPAANEVWERLKNSISRPGMRTALHSLEKWLMETQSGWYGAPFPKNLTLYGDRLFDSKSLHNYPGAERATSDDKRILFFAKVLAGLRFGLTPSYATKKLNQWTFRKEDAVNPFKNFVAQFKKK